MATLAELIAERRAALKAFESDIYGQGEHDISTLNDAIERTPIISQGDASQQMLLRCQAVWSDESARFVLTRHNELRQYACYEPDQDSPNNTHAKLLLRQYSFGEVIGQSASAGRRPWGVYLSTAVGSSRQSLATISSRDKPV